MADLEKNNVEEIVDEEMENNIVTLTDEETGEEQDFELYASAVIDDKLYYALVPVDEESDEYIILSASEDGEDIVFETIDDDEEFDKVAEYFDDLLFSDVDYDVN